MSAKPIEERIGHKGFDYWSRLLKNDPAAFERERKEAIDAAIAEAPEHVRPKLRQLQANIDEMAANDDFRMMTVLRLHHMMWETYSEVLMLSADFAAALQKHFRTKET